LAELIATGSLPVGDTTDKTIDALCEHTCGFLFTGILGTET